MIVFHTDLDNTLIYSYRHDIGEGKRCVEIYQGREISFVTQETYQLLHRLSEQKSQVLIVPTTTRTIEQYQRIDLGVGAFPYALVCNGGVLLTEDNTSVSEDRDWYRDSLEMIRDSVGELHKALELLKRDKRRTFELRFIRELYIFTKCDEPETVVADLKMVLNAEIVDVFNNGAKVYVVPKALNKGRAVERFRAHIGADYAIAAGDSEFDISMLEAADMGIAAPELAKRCSFSGKVQCPSMKKVFSEAVLEMVCSISAEAR
ncbi:MAG: HAD hydrolase family protein [Lachnospiraceae bacterium]|nr:HAD hydrolase family protein [Lachnospiraceae bacterium]